MRQLAATTTAKIAESLGARIVRLASQARLIMPKPREPRRGDHEYVRDRAKALAVIRERAETRAELAQKLGRIEGTVIGFSVFRAGAPPPHATARLGGGGEWPDTARAIERIERPAKRRGRPGRRGRLVAALARSRSG
jgi:hypothetical protein